MMSLKNEIQRLTQIVIEDKYNRKNIREKVTSDVMQGLDTQLTNQFIHACECIDDYKGKVYTKKKENRLWQIRHIPSSEIVTEMFIAVIDCQKPAMIQKLINQIVKFLEFDNAFAGAKTVAELFAICKDSGLYTMTTNPMLVQCNFNVSNETRTFIENTMFLPPMVCEPKDWTNNYDGGYITKCDSVILGYQRHHEYKQGLDVLNILQSIEWELDTIALQEKESMKIPEHALLIAGTNFAQLVTTSKYVYNMMLKYGNSFYFEWKVDYRGRIYDTGYQIHFQSSEFKKSILNFKPEVIK